MTRCQYTGRLHMLNPYVIVAGLIEDASRLQRELHVIGNVVTEFVCVLQSVYERDDDFIRALLVALFSNPGISYQPAYPLVGVLDIWPGQIGDYGAAVLAAAALDLRKPVLTFDRKFARQLTALGIECESL